MQIVRISKFFYVGTPSGVHLFDHLLWPIFQSSIYILHYTISSSSYMFIPMLGHDHQSLDYTQSTAITSTIFQSANFCDCLYAAVIQI